MSSKKGSFPIPSFSAALAGETSGTFTDACFTPNGSEGTWVVEQLTINDDTNPDGTHASMRITYSFPELSINTLCAYIQEINELDDNVNFSINLRADVTTNQLQVNIVRKDNQEIWDNNYSFLMTILF